MKKKNSNSARESEQIKEAIVQAMDSYDSATITQMLVQQGYDPSYVQSLIDEIEEEEGAIGVFNPETVIPKVDETTMVEEVDPMDEARKQLLLDMQEQTEQDDLDDDADQDIAEQQFYNQRYGGLTQANYGIEVGNMPNAQFSKGMEQPFITWPTMEGDMMKNGGMPNKRSFLKKMTKHLMKANMGMEQDSDLPSTFGDVGNPMGQDVSGKANFVSAINKQAQMFQAKEQANQMYNNMSGMNEGGNIGMYGPPSDLHDPMEHLNIYGESVGREFRDPTSMETMQFGGMRNRRLNRANRALFGMPMMPPGAKVDYEFGPLGGLRRASAETDLAQYAELFKMLPGSPNANPLVTLPGVITQMGYTLKTNQGRLVPKIAAAVNNQTLNEVEAAANTKPTVTATAANTNSVIPSVAQITPTNNNSALTNNPKQTIVPLNTKPKNNTGLPEIGKKPAKKVVKPELGIFDKIYNTMSKINLSDWNNFDYLGMQNGGFVDGQNPDLYEFIYGGDDISAPYIDDTDMYRDGGYLPRADAGMSAFDQFRLQKMNPDGTLKNKPTLSGGQDLMANPYTSKTSEIQGLGYDPSKGPSNQPAPKPGEPAPKPGQQQFNPQQLQMMQQMLMQQGQQPYAFGAPRGLGLGRSALRGLTGLSRDFNYMTGDNPANWNIPEGYTQRKQEIYKDRGKILNPFDNKRVYTDTFTKPGDPKAPVTNTSAPAPIGPGLSGFNADSNGDNIPDYLSGAPNPTPSGGLIEPNPQRTSNFDMVLGDQGSPVIGATNMTYNPSSSTGPQLQNDYSSTNVKGLSANSRDAIREGEQDMQMEMRRSLRKDPNAFNEGPVQEGQTAPMSDEEYAAKVNPPVSSRADGFNVPEVNTNNRDQDPMQYMRNSLSLSPSNNSFNYGNRETESQTNKPGVFANEEGVPFSDAQYQDKDYLQRNPAYAMGGYIPDYNTFDGYLPYARNGIVSDTPDFQIAQDPNAIKFTREEQSGFSFDPATLGENIGRGANMASGILEDLQSVKNKRFGSNKVNYASDIDRQLAYRGVTDQEGIDKKTGYETGRTYTGKYGGSKYKQGGQYKTGQVYSLTKEQIDEIRKMGGDVEFI